MWIGGEGHGPRALDTFTIRPAFDFRSNGSIALVIRNTPKTFVSYVFCKASISVSLGRPQSKRPQHC